MNHVVLIGNLATDPELRHTSTGREVCNFRLAVSRIGNDEADFFTVVAWDRQAQVCKEYLSTGRRVAVEGRLHYSTWESDSKRRSKVEVVAHRVELLGRPSVSRAATEPAPDADADSHTEPESTPSEQAELTAGDNEFAPAGDYAFVG